jgi:RND superfamily putative drug exporter
MVAAVANWSTRHRTLAITGWLALVVLAVLSSALATGDGAPATDPGEAGRAQQMVEAQDSGDSVASPMRSARGSRTTSSAPRRRPCRSRS